MPQYFGFRIGVDKSVGLLVLIALVVGCEPTNRNVVIERDENGNYKFLKRYRDNKLNGESMWFYPNGSLKEKVRFRNGLANGHAHYFYVSGALKSHRFWINDKMVGYCADYFDDTAGIIMRSLIFDSAGHLVFKRTYDRLGKVLAEERSSAN